MPATITIINGKEEAIFSLSEDLLASLQQFSDTQQTAPLVPKFANLTELIVDRIASVFASVVETFPTPTIAAAKQAADTAVAAFETAKAAEIAKPEVTEKP